MGVSNSELISPNKTAAFSFINVLELVALATLEANDELVCRYFSSARAIENTPVAPCTLTPASFLQ
jgi:hypothetical protein